MNNKHEQLSTRNAELEAELARTALILEQQSRELRIEAALEKVRSSALAISTPADMPDVCRVISEQMEALNIGNIRNVQTAIFKEEKGTYINYEYYRLYDKKIITEIDYSGHRVQHEFAMKMMKEPGTLYSYTFTAAELKDWVAYQKTTPQFADPHLDEVASLSYYWFSLGPIAWGISAYSPLGEGDIKVVERFRNVFDLAYRRYADIQRAEEQAHEVQIELALERVRARAIAMQGSYELAETVSVLFRQLIGLGIPAEQIRTCGIATFDDDKPLAEQWITETNGEVIPESFMVPYDEAPAYRLIYESWKKGEKFLVIHLEGEALKQHLDYLGKYTDVPIRDVVSPEQAKEIYNHVLFFSQGCIFIITKEALPRYHDVFKRFGTVLEQSYTRFLDLQKAEAQAREAQIQLGLERVRAKAMAMQTSEELNELIGTVFGELTKLDFVLTRCLIMIFDPETNSSRWWMANSEVPSAPMSYLVQYHKNPAYAAYLKAWKAQNLKWRYALKGKVKRDWDDFLFVETELSLLPNFVIAGMKAPEQVLLSASFNNFGCLTLVSLEPLSDEQSDIMLRFAKVFDMSYTRFNDLKIAEMHALRAAEDLVKLQEEKKRTEEALTDLRATQKQLIQSEKMASLGELTAGIAHEIQNPLNFVNNFSEVSVELLEELKEEAESGNNEDVIAIANDLTQNLEKIRHHGKRADGIVKGMLEHSRASAGQKEPININALANEYLKLSYHGLRAKDKSFNADMLTHFDPNLPLVSVIGQDIGRVLLNLFNNAFYAVSQKSKTADEGYKPTVEVSTSVSGEQVIIKVKDNGNGIPDAIKDKIMQPFFTTKPAGEGTGLGLSLSYDIVVKGHGGKLEVNTIEGAFTEFIVTLPLTYSR